MRTRGIRAQLTGAIGALVVALSAAACGDDTEAAYCSAWDELVTAFADYDEIDLVQQGTDSVRTYFDRIEAAADELEAASTSQFGAELEAFTGALGELATTIFSPDLPVDRAAEVRAASDVVDERWSDLIDAVDAGCS